MQSTAPPSLLLQKHLVVVFLQLLVLQSPRTMAEIGCGSGAMILPGLLLGMQLMCLLLPCCVFIQ